MTIFEVFDPPMCCSSGVCGPSIDPALVRFAADLDWLKGQGVKVWRFNLAQDPQVFTKNRTVQEALEKDGGEGLPMVFCDATLVASGRYPSRGEMAQWAGLTIPIGRETDAAADEGEKKQGGCCDSSGTPASSSGGGEPEGCCG